MDEGRYTNVILEEMRDQIQAILEITTSMQPLVMKIPIIEGDIKELKDDIRLIKKAVTDTNKDLKLLERRVTKLEEAKV